MAPPPFGTASAYADAFPAPPPRQVIINAETCYNLAVFRDMVRSYRRLDDQIITRLNRAAAQARDETRLGLGSRRTSTGTADPSWYTSASSARPSTPSTSSGPSTAGAAVSSGMCLSLWSELMSGWMHRQTLLSFCRETVERGLVSSAASAPVASSSTPSASGAPTSLGNLDTRHGAPPTPADLHLPSPAERLERGWTRGRGEEEVLGRQLVNEESVEAIIRKRSLDAFKTRCPFFLPPPSDPVGRAWWDLADSGRAGRGPDRAS